MERYLFVVLAGRREVLREEVLAATEEAAVEVASLAMNAISDFWTVAMLTDETGRTVCRLGNTQFRPDSSGA